MSDATAHPFAHIAPGPYKFVGLQSTEDRELINAMAESEGAVYTTNLCGGSCDHCGTPIWNVFFFRGSNGVKFKVGETCAEKADGEDTTGDSKAAMVQARKASKAAASKRRKALAERKIEALRTALETPDTYERLAAIPHPQAWRAERGDTLADWAAWFLKNAGQAGKLKAAKAVAAALAA